MTHWVTALPPCLTRFRPSLVPLDRVPRLGGSHRVGDDAAAAQLTGALRQGVGGAACAGGADGGHQPAKEAHKPGAGAPVQGWPAVGVAPRRLAGRTGRRWWPWFACNACKQGLTQARRSLACTGCQQGRWLDHSVAARLGGGRAGPGQPGVHGSSGLPQDVKPKDAVRLAAPAQLRVTTTTPAAPLPWWLGPLVCLCGSTLLSSVCRMGGRASRLGIRCHRKACLAHRGAQPPFILGVDSQDAVGVRLEQQAAVRQSTWRAAQSKVGSA